MAREREMPVYPARELAPSCFPPIQVCEDSSFIRVRALIPGVDPENISLDLAERRLALRFTTRAAKGRFLRHERPTGSFQRIIALPCAVSDAPAVATYRNGVLSVELPKAGDGRRSIAVVAGGESGVGAGEPEETAW